jgi:D-beta-D-heptose 7-phosphate kinase/D-beta-D-heptose 1-phosphate adenosyltransferase
MIDVNELSASLDRFAEVKVLVVGDVMLDAYWSGQASRLSPEAPVPVVNLTDRRDVPGGAANVAVNVNALGAYATLTGIIGDDDAGDRLCRGLEAFRACTNGLVRSATGRRTTTKTRVLVHKQQIVRIDDEVSEAAETADEEAVIAKAAEAVSAADVIVISDYAKGCLTKRVIEAVISEGRRGGRPVIVDPKSRDLTKYNGATLLTPNLGEAMLAANMEYRGEDSVDEAARKILDETQIDSLLITLGEHGMKLFSRSGGPIHFASMARDVYDVTGAGDTVVASLAVGVGARSDLPTAVRLANIAAGLVVEKVGTSTVSPEEIRAAIYDRH